MGANIQSCAEPALHDVVTIENISTHGARVRTRLRWSARERVELQPAMGGECLAAEVVYCERLVDSGYAIGLKFARAVDWY